MKRIGKSGQSGSSAVDQSILRQPPRYAALPTDANTTILLRTATQAEVLHKQLYQALNLKPDPIGKRTTIVDRKNP
jgi:hypothetical protein